MPKNRRPQTSVAASAYIPVNGVGERERQVDERHRRVAAAAPSSSVPCHRCHWIIPPEPNSVVDQTPIIPAPSAA